MTTFLTSTTRERAEEILAEARLANPALRLVQTSNGPTGGSRQGPSYSWSIEETSIEAATLQGRNAAMLGHERAPEGPIGAAARSAFLAAYDRYPEGEVYCPEQHIADDGALSLYGIVPVAGDPGSRLCPRHRGAR